MTDSNTTTHTPTGQARQRLEALGTILQEAQRVSQEAQATERVVWIEFLAAVDAANGWDVARAYTDSLAGRVGQDAAGNLYDVSDPTFRVGPMTLAEARSIASDWHGGQSSALYALASTGTVLDGVLREIEECVPVETCEAVDLANLADWCGEQLADLDDAEGWVA